MDPRKSNNPSPSCFAVDRHVAGRHGLGWLALFTLLILSGCYVGYGTFSFSGPFYGAGVHRERAESLRSQGKLEQAISEYREHIAYLKGLKSLPVDLNPDFYQLAIGDIFLAMGNITAALESYQAAADAGVAKDSIVDRVRGAARHLSAEGRHEEAIALLEKYRELDPLLVDSDLDTLHKAIIWKEDGHLVTGSKTPQAKPTPR